MEEITSPNQQIEISLAPSSSHNDSNGRVQEEAHISFNIGDLDQNWVSSITERHLCHRLAFHALSTEFLTDSANIMRMQMFLKSSPSAHFTTNQEKLNYKSWKNTNGDIYMTSSLGTEGSLEQYLVAVKELEERARDCYSEVITLASNSFVEMMVLDGCFIIELFRKYLIEDFNDVVFRFDWLIKAVIADLIMLENLIPFFVLQSLFDLIDGTCPSPLLVERAFMFFGGLNLSRMTRIKRSTIQIQHLLHLVYIEDILFPDDGCSGKGERVNISSTGTFLDIKFQEGVIEIHPTLDVEILRRRGIIIDGLFNEERAAALFNNMGTEISLPYNNFYFSGVCTEINQYSERAWPKLRESLVDDYFKYPWSITIFFAALLLLLLFMTQTFFSSFPNNSGDEQRWLAM
ncbi:UPF0481-like protein [Cinnamomum micranthum f. kanehirae]|uniref:UPF0481-like protein n=1 Tax=Cinnamomum micranthum f. kanehirae TaxID=337451 RepID=A0A443P1V4_9MAGN|nr:UPF0481-like protein [Cinnamomum micranthum f. kanehirae]